MAKRKWQLRLLEFSDDVVDIREQYPLIPIEDTMDIASELGISLRRTNSLYNAITLYYSL